jgi:hypothetical protein
MQIQFVKVEPWVGRRTVLANVVPTCAVDRRSKHFLDAASSSPAACDRFGLVAVNEAFPRISFGLFECLVVFCHAGVAPGLLSARKTAIAKLAATIQLSCFLIRIAVKIMDEGAPFQSIPSITAAP